MQVGADASADGLLDGAMMRPGAAAARQRLEAITTAGLFYPAFALVAVVSFFPLFYAVRQSLHRTDYLETAEFVGLRNFFELFGTGGGLHFLSVSLLFVGGTLVLAVPLGIGLALLLSRKLRFQSVFRVY